MSEHLNLEIAYDGSTPRERAGVFNDGVPSYSMQAGVGGCFGAHHSTILRAGGALAGQRESSSMVLAPRGVRDVPAEEFIRAYADHLKTNDKVRRDWMKQVSNSINSVK